MSRPTLHTERMRMVPLSDEHLELEVELDADPEVLRFLYGRARSRDEVLESHTKRLVAGDRGDGLGYWMAFGPDGEFIGLMMLPPKPEPGAAELGYRLSRRVWRRGYASEASRELLRYAFEEAGQTRVVAETMTINAGSRAVMEKVGLRYVRTFFPDLPPIPGSDQGEVEYAITREQWLARG
ncbi:GNAT family N-acetyltransferase [Actinoplanes couchii]|uniref:GNAT family acetyltransferase n=1 Tax=Actinoplanes couchii TaxID=403638 RepID=A0ABQ3X7E5_9ACTN|nr:GNAT family N-acetyltransferase [Actinoplanes couchii]MDR6322169.1 RimJ/RimL family protein N-acetyltransferase [Actinoplanes couchii]GID54333.1 GNAT family acetyltransferase [Actinoplanes couchii]